MSDREQLAARLVEAAVKTGEAVDREVIDAGNSCCAMVIVLAPPMIATVLRELAEELPPAWAGLPEKLADLADYIEKGATDG